MCVCVCVLIHVFPSNRWRLAGAYYFSICHTRLICCSTNLTDLTQSHIKMLSKLNERRDQLTQKSFLLWFSKVNWTNLCDKPPPKFQFRAIQRSKATWNCPRRSNEAKWFRKALERCTMRQDEHPLLLNWPFWTCEIFNCWLCAAQRKHFWCSIGNIQASEKCKPIAIMAP